MPGTLLLAREDKVLISMRFCLWLKKGHLNKCNKHDKHHVQRSFHAIGQTQRRKRERETEGEREQFYVGRLGRVRDLALSSI